MRSCVTHRGHIRHNFDNISIYRNLINKNFLHFLHIKLNTVERDFSKRVIETDRKISICNLKFYSINPKNLWKISKISHLNINT